MGVQVRRESFHALGEAWAGNSVNTVPFRTGVLTDEARRLVAFYDPQGNIVVGEQVLATGRITSTRIDNAIMPFDAHRCISIGVDQSGILHLAYGAHSSTLQMTSSQTNCISDGFAEHFELHGALTYPFFMRLPGSELALIFREGAATKGAIRISRFALESKQWVADDAALISGLSEEYPCGPYINTPVSDRSEGVAIFCMWRLPESRTSGGQVVNVGIDCAVSHDGLRTFASIHGIGLSRPLSPNNSERVIAVPVGHSLINQSSATILPNFRPAVVSYWAGNDGIPQYRLGWYDGETWRVSTVSSFETAFKLDGTGTLPLPHSRPEVLSDDDGRILLIYRSREHGNRLFLRLLKPPDYQLSGSTTHLLVDDDLGFYEPVLDRGAWLNRKEIVLYVQRCNQNVGGDSQEHLKPEPAFLGTWKLTQPRTWLSLLSRSQGRDQ